MAKTQYTFEKDQLNELYDRYGSFSLAAKHLNISKVTFRQQFLRLNNKCIICAKDNDSDIGTCIKCTVLQPEPPAVKTCMQCGDAMVRPLDKSKLAWSKTRKCQKCTTTNTKSQLKAKSQQYSLTRREVIRSDSEKLAKIRDYQKLYRQSRRGKLKRQTCNARRRAAKITTTKSPSVDEYIFNLLNSDSAKCTYCYVSDNLSIDHVIPLVRGGEHVESNLEVVCRTCNSRKGSKTKDEYLTYINLINTRTYNG